MNPDALVLPAWSSLLVGMALFFARKWISDVARAIDNLDERMRAYEKAQIDCRLELAKGYPTREETLRLAERLDTPPASSSSKNAIWPPNHPKEPHHVHRQTSGPQSPPHPGRHPGPVALERSLAPVALGRPCRTPGKTPTGNTA